MKTYEINSDTNPVFLFAISDSLGRRINLLGLTVKFTAASKADATEIAWSKKCDIANPSEGACQAILSPEDTKNPGDYIAELWLGTEEIKRVTERFKIRILRTITKDDEE